MEPTTYKLQIPVMLGDLEVSEVTLTPVAKAFKGFKQKVYQDGSVEFDTYEAATCAVRMAGQSTAFLEKLHPTDMTRLAQIALGFFVSGRTTGKTS